MTNKTILDDILNPVQASQTANSTDNTNVNDTKKSTENEPNPEFTIIENKGINKNPWIISKELLSKHLNPVKTPTIEEVDELPTEAEFNKQSARHSIRAILQPSEFIIDKAIEYLKVNNVKTRPITEEIKSNTFKDNNIQYVLDSEELTQRVYNIALNLKEPETQTKILKKQRTLLGLLKEIADIKAPAFENEALKLLDFENISKLLKRALSNILLSSLKGNIDDEDYTSVQEKRFHKNTACTNIGAIIFDAYMKLNYIYKETSTFVRNTGEDLDKQKAYHFVKHDKKELEDTLAKGITIGTPLHDAAVTLYLKQYLKNDPENNKNKAEHISTSENYYEPLLQYQMNIGYELVTWLLSNNIFTEYVNEKNVPCLEINGDLKFDLIGAASLFKPFISTKGFPEIIKITTEQEKIQLSFGVNNNKIPNEKYTKIKLPPNNKRLLELLEEYSNVPHMVVEKEFEEFLTFLEEILSADLLSEPVFDFLLSVYQIDFKQILAKPFYYSATYFYYPNLLKALFLIIPKYYNISNKTH